MMGFPIFGLVAENLMQHCIIVLRMDGIPTIAELDAEIESAVKNEDFLKAHQLKKQKQVHSNLR